MKVLKLTTTLILVVCLMWMMISWIDVINHNDPCGKDGDPSAWNAFVVMTEAME